MRDLVERAQRGDHDAFDELAARVGPDLYRLAVAVIGPDGAGDATQDARLNVDQRTVVTLHYQLDLPIREVARTLAIPDGTVKSRLNAALVALRRSLGDPADG